MAVACSILHHTTYCIYITLDLQGAALYTSLPKKQVLLSLNAVTIGGAISTQLSEWYITGYVSSVPVPAAVWLFGSGLIGLAALARQRKA